MRAWFLACLLCCVRSFSQELPAGTEQQLEIRAEQHEEVPDEQELIELEQFRGRPLNLNTAGLEELRQLVLLNEMQIQNLLRYRELFGKFISIYELQAVPGWDPAGIRRLLPFVTVDTVISPAAETMRRWRGGEHSVLLRTSRSLEGYASSLGAQPFLGGRGRIFLRYQYRKGNFVQYGVGAEKDEGERFFSGAQKFGFDFYSLHFFLRELGAVRQLALGDFTVNLGQGLIHWQGMGFGKSVNGIRKQGSVFRPHSSAGEFNFHRGVALALRKNRLDAAFLISSRRLSANLVFDSARRRHEVTSLLSSGLHRTPKEVEDRHRLVRWTVGGMIGVSWKGFQFRLNGVHHAFSVPLARNDEPYRAFAIHGVRWQNFSFDYSGTVRNLHLFGEVAIDRNRKPAFVHGFLMSVDSRADLAVLLRVIPKEYQAHGGSAFTENTNPNNETGIFAGITLRPATGWQLDAFADLFRFPWLRYGADEPAWGKEFSVQLTWQPARPTELSTRLRLKSRLRGERTEGDVITVPTEAIRRSWRTEVNHKFNLAWSLRHRVELSWQHSGLRTESGFFSFVDLQYRISSTLSGTGRLQYFDTDGYDARIYAFEYDISSGPSIPAFFDSGLRYYLVLRFALTHGLSAWIRWAQTIYNYIRAAERRSELGLQLRWQLGS